MLGAILGDIVGSVFEFSNTRDYHFNLFVPRSNYTDDTVMSVAVADWAMSSPHPAAESLEQFLVDYGNKYPSPMGGYGCKFEEWLFCPEELTDYQTGKLSGKRCPYYSCGNGSAMRVSAIGWLFDTLEETERYASISAAITHNHPEGIKGAQAVAGAVFKARTGASKAEIRQYVEKTYGYTLNQTWEELHDTYDWDSTCQGTVPPALIAFLSSTDFEDAIRRAVSIGGDSDTLACITGAVAEAYYQDIPDFMVTKARKLLPPSFLKVLGRMAERAYQGCYEKYIAPALPEREFTPRCITSLAPNEVFVFGSNLGGLHGGGAARLAFENFGAEWGVGVGMTGQCYAIPTMQGGVDTIVSYVDEFIDYALQHPELKFFVTKIGCGIAGFAEEQIAPLFKNAMNVPNIILPESFYYILKRMTDSAK